MRQQNASKKITGASPLAENAQALCSPLAHAFSNIIEVRLGEAKVRLRSREFGKAVDKCSEVIDAPDSSDGQRKGAHLVRGKALFALGMLSAAAFDFYKVLEADHNHSEAYGYILQIEADAGLPLTKK